MRLVVCLTVFNQAVQSGSFQAVLLAGVGGAVQLLTVAALFILVLILTYFTTRFIGSYQKGKLNGSNIKLLDSLHLSANKLIQIVRVGDKCFAIAVCKDTVTLLGEIDGNELSLKEQGLSANDTFDAFLDRFRRKDESVQQQESQDEERDDR